MMPHDNDTLLQTYRKMVQEGELHHSPQQNLVIEQLQILSHRLEHYTPPPETSFFASLFGEQQTALKGLYIFGGVGSGKTMLMDLFFEHINYAQKQRLHFSAFMEYIHQQIKEVRKLSQADPITLVADHFIQHTTLLCLDEFQVTDITDAMLLDRLFQSLFQKGLVLVTTGNIAPQNLYASGLNRMLFLPFIDLLEEHMDIIELETGQDFRRTSITTQTVWFLAPHAESNEPYLKLWHSLINGLEANTDRLIVNEHPLPKPIAYEKIARFSFAALCSQDLGKADYLAIAKHYNTLFIDDIPMMKAENINEARRFTWLIDTLYDQKVTLIASAQVLPDELFVFGSTAQEFKRTASRLIEMSQNHLI